MSRTFSKEIMGFYAIDPKHHAAITSLVAPATPAHKLLDPYAGEGGFPEVAAKRAEFCFMFYRSMYREDYRVSMCGSITRSCGRPILGPSTVIPPHYFS